MTLVAEAVFARALSSLKDERVAAEKSLGGPRRSAAGISGDFVEDVRRAMYASKIVSYAQGFIQLSAASRQYGWDLDLSRVAKLWRAGCIWYILGFCR